MEVQIVEEQKNGLLERTEIEFVVVGEETPERLAVRDSLAAKLDKKTDEVIIENLGTRFGMNETLGKAKIYESPKAAKELEEEYMLERNKIEKQKDGEIENKQETEKEEKEVGSEEE